MRAERRQRRQKKNQTPRLTRADVRRSLETAASYGISDEEAIELGQRLFGFDVLEHLPSKDIERLCDAIAQEGERRFEILRQAERAARIERERAAAVKQARALREKATVLQSRKDWSERCNRARLERRRARKASKRR